MRRVLITGVCGVIGSHLAEEILRLGIEVIGIDNLQTGQIENISSFQDAENFAFFRHDVVDPYFYEVDYIFNLACPASPAIYQDDPVKTLKTSVIGAINALELAKSNGCGVLQASTSEVYGDPLISPQNESYFGNVNPIGVRACYDEGKRVAETLFFDYHRKYGVNIKVVRIFNTYGPRMKFDDGRVISNFIYQALTGLPITIYGDGKQTRSFCYVSDLVDGLIKIAMLKSEFQGPVNLGNPEEYSINELASLIQDLVGCQINVRVMDLPLDDPKIRKPDITMATKAMEWLPTVSLVDGLRRTIQDFRERLELSEKLFT